MAVTTVFDGGPITVVDYRCEARPGDTPFVEWHEAFTISYVRAGSFGYRFRGEAFELVAGSFLIGHPGDEYLCTHDHVGGDRCLSFALDPALVDEIGASAAWRIGYVAPRPDLMVLGELGRSSADGQSAIGVDEVGLMLARRFVDAVSGRERSNRAPSAVDRRRAVETALWIDAHSHSRDRARRCRSSCRTEPLSLSADLLRRARRHAAPVPRPLTPAPRGTPSRRRGTSGHRYRVRRRVCRSVELRAHLPPCRGCITPRVSECRPRRSQDLPRSARG